MSAATIRDVAKFAGVGIGTVSRVINDSPSVSEATRNKVLSAIEALDYSPNPMARRLSLGKTLTIAVIAPFFTRPAVVERLRGIERILAESEYDLMVFNVETPSRRQTLLRDIPRRERIDGLIIISLSLNDDDVDRLLRAGHPTVLIDVMNPNFSKVTIDDVAGGRRATEHLLELGHERIAFLSDYADDTFDFTSNRDRLTGYTDALRCAGIEPRSEYRADGIHSRASAFVNTRRLLSLPERPTAIFASSDTLAIGALEAAQEMGIRVPEELSVIGYDDIEIAEYLRLTTIRQSLYESGIKGGELLLEEIATHPESAHSVVLPTELVVRDTTAPPMSGTVYN